MWPDPDEKAQRVPGIYLELTGGDTIAVVRIAGLVLLLLFSAQTGFAQPTSAKTKPVLLHYRDFWDPLIATSLTALFLVGELGLKKPLAPAACRWCQPPAFDRTIRDALVWSQPRTGEWLAAAGFLATTGAAFGGVALASAFDGRGDEAATNALFVLEAAGAAGVVADIVKYSVGRQRPGPYVRGEAWDNLPVTDHNLSFFSGHSAVGFALATSAGTVASLRGYRWAPAVWASGLTLAGFTAYSRLGADAHWFSDVMVGAIVGGGLGWLWTLKRHGPVQPGAPRQLSWMLLPMGLGARDGRGLMCQMIF